MRLSFVHVPDVKNSKEERSKSNLNTDHHSGEAEHQDSRYERVEQVAKIYSGPGPYGVAKCRQTEHEKRPTKLEDALCVRPSQHLFRACRAWQKTTFHGEIS